MNKKELEMLDFMSVSLSYWLPEKMMMNITVVIVAADGRFVFMLNWRYDTHIQIFHKKYELLGVYSFIEWIARLN